MKRLESSACPTLLNWPALCLITYPTCHPTDHHNQGLAAAKYLGHSLRAPVGYAGPDQHEPANVPYVILGAAILWFGWFGVSGNKAVLVLVLMLFLFLLLVLCWCW